MTPLECPEAKSLDLKNVLIVFPGIINSSPPLRKDEQDTGESPAHLFILIMGSSQIFCYDEIKI